MRRVIRCLTILCPVLIVGAYYAMAGAEMEPSSRVSNLGMTEVLIKQEYRSRDGKWLLAFVPSGSTAPRVLVSITAHWVPKGGVDYLAASMRVSKRFGPGVEIYATNRGGKPFPDDVGLRVTVAQPGAKFDDPMPAAAAGLPAP